MTEDTAETLTGQEVAAPTGWGWSTEACEAFAAAAVQDGGRIAIRKGLEAALTVDAGALFRRQLDGLVDLLSTHPVLGSRAVLLHPDPDGTVRLRIDRDLLRFVLMNELPLTMDPVVAAEEHLDPGEKGDLS